MKKILIIVPALDNKSPVKVAIEQGEAFIKMGHEVSFFIMKEKEDILKVNSNIKIINRYKNVEINKYTHIITHGLRPNIYGSFIKLFSSRNILLTIIHTNIDLDLKDVVKNKYIRFLIVSFWKKCILKHDKIICLNSEVKSIISKKENDNCKVLPNGINGLGNNKPINDDVFLSFLKDKDKIYIGSACVVRDVKGIKRVLNLLSYNKKLKFILIGDGPELQNLKKESKNLDIESQCLFLGFKPNPFDYLQYIDVCVMPSYSEGFPLFLIESMASGIPCVTSDIPAFREFFNNEITRCNPDDVLDFNKAINYSVNNRNKLSVKCKAIYLSRFTADIITEKIDNFMG